LLDEIGDMAQFAQAEGACGASRTARSAASAPSRSIHVDVRVLAATNKDLKQEVSVGNFREDLLLPSRRVSDELPALRERPRGHPLLAEAPSFSSFCARTA
jgi:transcriptional regulator with GAF, ATPase, and Fis domain